MAADAPRMRRAAAARVTRVRRAVRASGEQRCSRAANSPAPGREAGSMRHLSKQRPEARGNVRCFELFGGKGI